MKLEAHWGYYSESKDTEKWTAQICEKCVDEKFSFIKFKKEQYTPNKKNGGIIPECKDERTLSIPIGCGKCIECRKQKARQWQVRLHEEIKSDNTGKFVTLSFSEESLYLLSERINSKEANRTAKEAVRLFRKRWEKNSKKA